MTHRLLAGLLAATFLLGAAAPARADNPMGYRLLTDQEARSLPRAGGVLGMQVERSAEIRDSGMQFQVVRVTGVRSGSPGERAGLRRGDQIIAVNGRVFQDADAFAALVASMPPGSQATIDYIPSGGGPAQAQRVNATLGGRGTEQRQGLSTGEKVAIGVGAAALLGCYELGCFNHRQPQQQQPAYR